jgi:AAA15 family ATPase/GTPase
MRHGGEVVLISFTVENAFSFKDETTLDMRASNIKAHSYSLINEGRNKLLPVAAIYGANASGKTNLMRLLECALNSIQGEDTFSIPFLFRKLGDSMPYPYYKLQFLIKLPSNIMECEYSFMQNGPDFYNEEFKCVEPDKKNLSLIYKREYNDENKQWKLTKGKSKLAREFASEIIYVNEMEPDQSKLLLTALGKRARFPIFQAIFNWVSRASLHYQAQPPKLGRPIFRKEDDMISFVSDKKSKDDLTSFMKKINPIIKDISIDKVNDNDSALITHGSMYQNNNERYTPLFDYDLNSESNISICELISNCESMGVWTALFMYPRIHRVLNNGGIFIVDELERSLHPLLITMLISLFASPETNPGHGQLIFSTHNALIMDKKLFRQDEIVFVEKDETGASSIYRLSDIEGVRSDLDFCKNYIMGAFGAIPNL